MTNKDPKILWVTDNPHEDSYTIDDHLLRAGIELDYCPWAEQVNRRLSTGQYSLVLVNGDGLTPPAEFSSNLSEEGDSFKKVFDRANKGDKFNYMGRPAVSLELVKRLNEKFPEITILTYGIDELTVSTKELRDSGSKEHLIAEGRNSKELADKIADYAIK